MAYETVTSQLDSVKNALADEDLDQLDTALEELTAAYNEIKASERARVARLQAARSSDEVTPDQQKKISRYERSFMASYFGRGGFIGSAELYLLDPMEVDATELTTQVSDLIDREQQLSETTKESGAVSESVTLPPRLGVLRFAADPKSPIFRSTSTVELTLQNVGDEAAEEVQATVDTETLETPLAADIGTLAAENRQTRSFDIPANVGDELEITVSVESSNAGTVTETETINVRTKSDILEQAKQELENLRTRITDSLGTKGLARSLTSKIDAAIDSIDRALSEVEAGRRKQTDNAITTATNQLGALLNSIAGKSKNRNKNKKGKKNGKKKDNNKNTLPEILGRSITNRTELVIDQLSDARDTPIAK